MVVGIIPARLASTRFPKKILANLNGKPMVAHVVEQAMQVKSIDKVILAIDNEETENVLSKYDIDIEMTSKNHNSGTDRVAEVAKKYLDADLIINIQGDEPLLDPIMVDEFVKIFEDTTVNMATIVSRRINIDDLLNPNVVKAFLDRDQNAKDFKRSVEGAETNSVFRHVGIYGFRREALFQFTCFPKSKREKEQSLEQLRALDNDMCIKALITDYDKIAVDTYSDLKKVSSEMKLSLAGRV
tara:strand:+ start:43622 stop:44347 length:726 start_codon:yes stop_codon:yes gene_type:complete